MSKSNNNLKSLALKTSLILDEFLSDVDEFERYITVKTPSRPDFFWGNYLIMKEAPSTESFEKWCTLFEKEFGSRYELGYMAITCDITEFSPEDFIEFEKNGFDLTYSKILTAKKVNKPSKINPDIDVRPFSKEDWPFYVDIHFTPNWGYGPDDEQKKFLRDEGESFKKVVDAGFGNRYGAFLNGKMIAELGAYWKDNIVRFNNVATHPGYRRLGACSTLVYEVSKMLLSERSGRVLVMEADENYHAASIYESVGFKQTEKHIAFEWVDKEKFPE